MKEWYCEVCGTIMEEKDVTSCSHCGMDKDFLKSFSVEKDSIDENTRILIIGNGVAGFTVAKTLRKMHSTCPIAIFTKGNHTPYNYMKLDKEYLNDIDKTALKDTTWYEQHKVELHHVAITHIDTQKQEIHSQLHQYPYDILILAMGYERILPDIPGNDLSQIYTIDALYDVHVLRKIIKPNRHGVLLGSDIASIELACALSDAHIQVDLIEPLPHIMPQELNMVGSELLSTYLKSQKIQLHTNRKIKEFHGISRIESIEFDDGKCINADFIICSGSPKANLSLLKDTPINYDKRILINKNMQTNIANVYACGGIAQTRHANDNHYLHARQQGMLVAFHILGINPPFQLHISPRYVKHDDFSICLLGDIHHYDQHIEVFDDTLQTYEKYCYNENECTGVILINSDHRIEAAIKHFNEKSSFYKHKKKVS